MEMLGERPVIDHLTASSIDVDTLRVELEHAISKTETYPEGDEADTQPNMEFQRVVQNAILETQSSGQREVSLVALLGAALKQQEEFLATRVWKSAQICSLCRKPTTLDSLTVIPGRSAICAECIAVVKALKT